MDSHLPWKVVSLASVRCRREHPRAGRGGEEKEK